MKRALLAVLSASVCASAARAEETQSGPILREWRAADYPPSSLFSGREAEVPCELSIDEQGAVSDVSCEAEADPAFSRPAQRALQKARFLPAQRNGKPVPSRLRFVYRFAQSAASLPPTEEPREYATVQGEVLAGGQRTAVTGVEVVAQGLGIFTSTDAKGHFTMKLPPGSHVLVFVAPYFEPTQARVELQLNEVDEETFYLRRRGVSEFEATVQGEREKRAASKSTIVREELRNVPGTQGDPIRVIEDLPGLARVPFSGGQLIVRGANAIDTGAYIDGQRIPVLYHLLNGPSVLGEEMVEKIDFYPGGAGVFYGRSLAGIVSVTSRHGDADRFHGSVAADLQKSAAFLQGPLGDKTQISLGLRRSYVNPVVKLFADPNKELTLPVYWDYQSRIDHKLSDTDRLSLTAYGSDDSFELVGSGRGSVPLSQGRRIGFHRMRLAWERALGESLQLTVAPTAGFDISTETSSGVGPGVFARPQNAEEHTFSSGVRSELLWRASANLEARAGVDVLFDRIRYDLDQLFDQQLRGVGAPNAEERRLSGVKVFGNFGEYAEAELKLGDLRITPGIRLEQLHYGTSTFAMFDPRLWARYVLARTGTTFHAYAGVYHQAPSAQQVDATIGNPNLTPMRADQFGLGFEQHVFDAWTVRMEGYLNLRRSLVFPAEPRARGDGTFDNPLQLNSGIGRSVGLEVLIRREFSARLYGWIAYTLSRSRELRRPGEQWLPTPFDQPHVLTMLLGVRVSPYIEFSTRLRLASGNPLAAVTSATFDADSGNYVPRQLPFGATRLPTFVQLDFEVNNIWSADAYSMSLYIDFQNVMNRLNPEVLLYDYRYEKQDFVHGLPFLASVGAKVSF